MAQISEAATEKGKSPKKIPGHHVRSCIPQCRIPEVVVPRAAQLQPAAAVNPEKRADIAELTPVDRRRSIRGTRNASLRASLVPTIWQPGAARDLVRRRYTMLHALA